MRRPGATIIGYGSLMSASGLARDGNVELLAMRRVQLDNLRRGFGKASIHADRFAMVVEPVDQTKPIRATYLADDERGDTPQAVALELPSTQLPAISKREGYSARHFALLQDLAGSAGVGAYLLALLWECGGDVRLYRERLHHRLDYTSPHYIPHPLRLGSEPAIIFLAPGEEGCGATDIVPVRVATGVTELLSVGQVWDRKPNEAQLEYIATCLRAEAHGLRLDDLRDELPAELAQLLASRIEHDSERRALARLLGS